MALAPTPLIDDEYMSRDVFVVRARDAKIRDQLGLVGKLDDFAWSPDGERIAWVGGEAVEPQAARGVLGPGVGLDQLPVLLAPAA